MSNAVILIDYRFSSTSRLTNGSLWSYKNALTVEAKLSKSEIIINKLKLRNSKSISIDKRIGHGTHLANALIVDTKPLESVVLLQYGICLVWNGLIHSEGFFQG